MLSATLSLAPFADLQGLAFYWHLPLVILLVSLVYSATRYDQWSLILREAGRWAVRLTSFLCAVILVLFLVATII
jgi:hypothetical protein